MGATAALVFLVHLTSTLFMTGLIWFVQVVHYPLFEKVGMPTYREYARAHVSATTWVVIIPMLIELGTGGVLIFIHPEWVSVGLACVCFALLVGVWLSTALLQVPRHNRLLEGWDSDAGSGLVSTNWIRTVLWSMRSAVLLGCLGVHLCGAGAGPV